MQNKVVKYALALFIVVFFSTAFLFYLNSKDKNIALSNEINKKNTSISKEITGVKKLFKSITIFNEEENNEEVETKEEKAQVAPTSQTKEKKATIEASTPQTNKVNSETEKENTEAKNDTVVEDDKPTDNQVVEEENIPENEKYITENTLRVLRDYYNSYEIWFAEFKCDISKCDGFKEHGTNKKVSQVIESRRGDIESIEMQAPAAKENYKFIGWRPYSVTYNTVTIRGYEAIYSPIN